MQDMFINDIVENLEYLEAPIIRNHISRVIIDLNRDKREINRKILKSFPSNLEFLNSLKAKAGIGLIPNKDSEGYEIYKEKLDWKIVKHRIENYYDPWHAILQKKIKSIKKNFGYVFLLDIHSMPSSINKTVLSDFVIGNNYDRASNEEYREKLMQIIRKKNYSVSNNYPFSGGFITKNYSDIKDNIFCIQIEINKKLYMNEDTFKKNKNFSNFSRDFKKIIEEFLIYIEANNQIKFAAE